MKGGKLKCSTADTIPFRRASIGEILADFLNERQRGRGACFPAKFFWISTSWVSETFRQDVGQFHSASDEALQIGDYYYYFLSPEIGKNIIQTIFQKKKI